MDRPAISLVASVARNGGIGRDGGLLVHLPGDLPRFKRLTMGAPVLMGRKTWQSIGRPLPGRRNIVITRDPAWQAEGAEPAGSLDDAIRRAGAVSRLSVIGGAQIYALALPLATTLELTEIDADLEADTFFPAWDRGGFTETSREPQVAADGLRYAFVTYRRNDQGGGRS
ncbi:MAG TPA: dihydrofolate reductase [Caldimonas sp.]|jgi:dihydrofolate reductase|nr:dihydrofolate reductase [Caldimonas sp.]HEX2541170.1 dihydrofolate reductase [Caldimonas sp.]